MRLSEIVARLGGELRGQDIDVLRVVALEDHDAQGIAYLANPKLAHQLAEAEVGAVILLPAAVDVVRLPCVVTSDPHTYFARLAHILHPLPAIRPGIHASAVVAATAQIDPSAEIGPQVVIGEHAKIGPRCKLHAGVVIGDATELGADCLLYPRVVIYHDCRLGERVVIHSGAVIGSDGFGNAWARDHWEKVPQIGRTIIGDDVEIGANTTIDRGALHDTVIARGARIDNLVQLGHNVHVGENSALAGCAGIAGSTVIGANCRIGGAVNMGGHLKIADGVTILGSSSVPSSIEEVGAVYSGVNPSVPYRVWRRNAIHMKNLDDLYRRIRKLEKRLGADDVQEQSGEEQ